MKYYFIKTCTNYGTLNFAACCDNVLCSISSAVRNEEKIRGIQIFSWSAETIDENEFTRLTS